MLHSFKATIISVFAIVLLLLGSRSLTAETATETSTPSKQGSMPDYLRRVASMRTLAQACSGDAAACDPSKVSDDGRVVVSATPRAEFQVRWGWLRQALEEARAAKPEDRLRLMQTVTLRLDETTAAQPETSSAQFPKARSIADRILSGAEFASVDQPSWLDRKMARFWYWWGRFWQGASDLGAAGPWLGRLLEWSMFGGAAVSLLLYARRNLRRQRLAVALNKSGVALAWTRESTDWAKQADASAQYGDWRDAVHCLYWATIVMLEGRRAWRHNPSRTPREYVRLLKPGSTQQHALRSLTRIFERLWYGLRSAGPEDYERARSLYESLRDGAAESTDSRNPAPIHAGAA